MVGQHVDQPHQPVAEAVPTPHPQGWAALPTDLLLLVLAHSDPAVHKSFRSTCSSWRSIVDTSMWHTVRGDLRNPDLGPLPKACVASMRLCRVELCFNSSFTVVSELDNDADMSAFVRAMARLKLQEYGHQQQKGGQQQPGNAPVLVLHFGNFFVHARTVEALLEATHHNLLRAWPTLEVYAIALPSAWPGQSCRAGLVLDGGLSGQLTATGIVAGMQGRAGCTVAQAANLVRRSSGDLSGLAAGLSGGAYRRLARCSLPMHGTALALPPNSQAGAPLSRTASSSASSWAASWAAAKGHDAAALLAATAPGLRVLQLAGPGISEGLGVRAGALLRPEHVAFCCMPPTVEEVEFVGAEMPRVHHSSTHFKPWEAVLLVETADYLLEHFVKPLAAAFPKLNTVRCLALRVPHGTSVSSDGSACVLNSAAWPMSPAPPRSTTFFNGLNHSPRASNEMPSGTAPSPGLEVVNSSSPDALWTFTWAGAEMRRAVGASIMQQVWRVATAHRCNGDVFEAADGLPVDQIDVTFTRER